MTWCQCHCHCAGTVQPGIGEGNGEKVAHEARPEDTCRRCAEVMFWQAVILATENININTNPIIRGKY